jgi:hypothetical protein
VKLPRSSVDPALLKIDAVGCAVCAALAGLWYFAGVRPLSEARASRESARTLLCERDAQIAELYTSRSAFQKSRRDMQERLDAGQVQLQRPDQINTRIDQLTQLAAACNLRIDQIKPEPPTVLAKYTTIQIKLDGAGSWADAARFLHQLKEKHPDNGITGFELRGEPEASDKVPLFSFSLIWYAQGPAPSASPSKSPSK